MSQVKSKDTNLEKAMRSALHASGLRFRKHIKTLPGKPDIVFPNAKVAVFIDGDYWHGYRFPVWEHKLSSFWREKIRKNRERDQKNFRKLRRTGWRVIRIWQHEIKKDIASCVARVISLVNV
jgi:DNA mismatch endonuclease (patch repair protein)